MIDSVKLFESTLDSKSIAVVIFSYGGTKAFSFRESFSWLGRIASVFDRLTLLSFRQYLVSNRDFVTNIRSPGYQKNLVLSLKKIFPNSELKILSQFDFESDDYIYFDDVQEILNIEADAYIFVYPDALGLGREKTEKLVRRATSKEIFILNGRRRLFLLNNIMSRKMFLRRFLAETRIIELIFAVFVLPCACAWAFLDGLKGKK